MTNLLGLTAVSIVLVEGISCTGARAAPIGSKAGMAALRPPAEVTEVAGRKGTRLYEADDPASGMFEDVQPQAAIPGDDGLEQCMQLWDPATHMTKAEWRGSCIRILRERAAKPDT